MKVVQINGVCGVGSTGRIVQDISKLMTDEGIENYIFYGQGSSDYPLAKKIGSNMNIRYHQLASRVTGKHALYSRKATVKLIEDLESYKPDIVHLHNVHGFYLNIEILFNYLQNTNIKIVWTLHDCWSFTGHCAYFDFVNCDKWKTQCDKCPNKKEYPISCVIDRSRKNFEEKKHLFNHNVNIQLVTPSDWLKNLLKDSYLANHDSMTINNGIDLAIFKPTPSNFKDKYNLNNKFVILCIAVDLEKRKGTEYMLQIIDNLEDSARVIVLGVSDNQKKLLSSKAIGITRTNNLKELAEIYSAADVYLNPTLEDNFPTTNLEALACGTPVITFNTGGSPEAIDEETGIVVKDKSADALLNAINIIKTNGKEHYKLNCVARAKKNYDMNSKYLEYVKLYRDLV